MRRTRQFLLGFFCGALATPGCQGGAGQSNQETDGGTDTAGDTDGGPAPESGVGVSGLRRLTRDEYDSTVRDILFDDTRPGTAFLPEDILDPFDNDFQAQQPSRVLIDALEAAATDISTRLLADPGRRDMVVGCTPASPTDAECLDTFIRTFGRRALRRPLTDAEVAAFRDAGLPFAEDTGDFYEAVDVVLRAMLQHPHFVYRVERGTPTEEEGVFRLGDFEVATRLSYLLWGTTPDDELLDLAQAGGLSTSEDVRATAELMLLDERSLDRIDRFHAMWLGYFQLPHDPDLTTAMRTETKALVEKVVFTDDAPWTDLFTRTGTFVNDALAMHYGLPAPGTDEFTWVEYGDDGRMGLLSHGAFLSVAGKFGDTSPTQRGKLIRTRLLCQVIPPPPPDVNVDEPPDDPNSNCKWDEYKAHRESGSSCKGCHDLMDPVGFGLENFDQAGAYRSYDAGYPECTISGDGVIDGQPFNGPAGLATLLVDGPVLDQCVVRQVYRFAMGHEVHGDDERYVADLVDTFRAEEHRFQDLLLALVEDEAFLFRREETP